MSSTNAAYIIRPALPEEKDDLDRLIAVSARALSREDYTESEIEAAVAHIFGVDSELIADGTYFAVVRGGEYLACGGWSKRRTLFGGDQFAGRQSGLLDPATEAAKIRAFFVHPDHARQGIGAALLKHCEDQARASGFAEIEMMATLPGVKLYRAFGYQSDAIVTTKVAGGGEVRFMPMRRRL